MPRKYINVNPQSTNLYQILQIFTQVLVFNDFNDKYSVNIKVDNEKKTKFIKNTVLLVGQRRETYDILINTLTIMF